MKRKLKFSIVYSVIVVLLYWIGVFIYATPFVRGDIMCANYALSIIMGIATFGLTYSFPNWKDN